MRAPVSLDKEFIENCLAQADDLIKAEAASRKDEHRHTWSVWNFDDPRHSKTSLQRRCETCVAVEYGTLAGEKK